ncbi:MAG: hypothetical protein KDC87_15225 [Planctomycetes bacterium]|nr:hypothetical protein [Planctomycetota bacterium]
MTTPTLIYIGFSGLTGLMCLWALASALFGGHEHRGLHRIVVFATALGLLAATGAAAFGPGTGHPRGVWATGLLPLLTLAATWSNLAALRGSGVLLKFVTLPILIYNLLHLGIYTVWSIHELAGWDTGTWGSAMLGADTHVQRLCGHPNAADDPRWLRLPILLPLGAAASITAVGSTLLTSLASGLTVALFAIVMPHAFLRTRSYHDAPQADLQALPKVGFKVPWATRVLSETERLRIRSHLLRLGATSVTFEVRDAMFGNQAVVDQARGEVQWAKAQGLQTIAIAQPPHRFEAIPAVSLDELRGGMAQTHWMTAEKLQVDLLVLFSGPLTRMAAMIGG